MSSMITNLTIGSSALSPAGLIIGKILSRIASIVGSSYLASILPDVSPVRRYGAGNRGYFMTALNTEEIRTPTGEEIMSAIQHYIPGYPISSVDLRNVSIAGLRKKIRNIIGRTYLASIRESFLIGVGYVSPAITYSMGSITPRWVRAIENEG